MATTADGWPYVVPADHPVEYPAVSQTLADLLEARWDTWQTEGQAVPGTGWADFSGGGLGLMCTKAAGLVVAELSLKATSALTLTAGWTAAATLPVGFRPRATRQFPLMIHTGSAYAAPGYAEINSAGGVGFRSVTSAALAANTGYCHCIAVFRGA